MRTLIFLLISVFVGLCSALTVKDTIPDQYFTEVGESHSLALSNYFSETNLAEIRIATGDGVVCVGSNCGQSLIVKDSFRLYLRGNQNAKVYFENTIFQGSYGTTTRWDSLNLILSPNHKPYLKKALADQRLFRGYNIAGPYSTDFGDAQSYQINSKNNLCNPIVSTTVPGQFYLMATGSAYGFDTLLIKASNPFGEAYDTTVLRIIDTTQAIEHRQDLGQIQLDSNQTFYLSLDQYFQNATRFTTRILSGITCINSTASTCIQTANAPSIKSQDGDQLSLRMPYNGRALIEIKAANAVDSTLDTLELIYGSDSLPKIIKPLKDQNFAFPFKSQTFYDTVSNSSEFTVQSLKNIVQVSRVVGQHFVFRVDTLPLRWGTDTLILRATNAYGSIADTMIIKVNSPIPTCTQKAPDINKAYQFGSSVHSWPTFSPQGAITSQSTQNLVKIQPNAPYSQYEFLLSSIDKKYGIDTLIISSSNSYGIGYDTIIVNIAAPTAPKKTNTATPITTAAGSAIQSQVYFTGCDTLQFSSKQGKIWGFKNTLGSCSFSFACGSEFTGMDSIIVKISNIAGSSFDTIPVRIYDAQKGVTQLTKLGTFNLLPKSELNLHLDDYFSNVKAYTINTAYAGLVFNSSSLSSDFKFTPAPNAGTGSTIPVSIKAIAGNGSTSTYTLNLFLANNSAPIRLKKMDPIELPLGFIQSPLLTSFFAYADSFQMTSIHAKVRPVQSSSLSPQFKLDSVRNQVGIDTIIVKASNAYGSSYDTVQVLIAEPTALMNAISTGLVWQNQALNLFGYGNHQIEIHKLNGQLILSKQLDLRGALQLQLTLVPALYRARLFNSTSNQQILFTKTP